MSNSFGFGGTNASLVLRRFTRLTPTPNPGAKKRAGASQPFSFP